jgi:hypothetical protein
MPETQELAQYTLQIIAGSEADSDALDELTRQLYTEMQDLDLEVKPIRQTAPPEGAKAGEEALIGSLAVSILPTLLPRLADFLQNWVNRGDRRIVKIKTQQGDRSVELEYAPSTMSNQELKDLLDLLTASVDKKS